MAGMHRRRYSVTEIVTGTLQLFRRRANQVKSPDDINNPVLPADLPRIFRDIADPCMRAAGDDDKPCPGLKRKGGIVQQEIRGGAAVGQENCPRSRICPLGTRTSWEPLPKRPGRR